MDKKKQAEEDTHLTAREPVAYDPNFSGPVKERSCTDVICLLLFLAFLVGWGVVAYFAFTLGNPKLLVYPTDSDGQLCGLGHLKDKPNLFFFDLTRCANPTVIVSGCPTSQVCVKDCPKKTFSAVPEFDEGIKDDLICKYDTDMSQSVRDLVFGGHCAAWYLNSTHLVHRCIPSVKALTNGSFVDDISNGIVEDINGTEVLSSTLNRASKYLAFFMNVSEIGEKVFQDFQQTWWIILIGLAVAMLISFIWILLMRFIAGFMVWLSIFVFIALLSFSIYYSYTRYAELEGIEGSDQSITEVAFTTNLDSYLALRDTWLAFIIIAAILLAIILLVLIFLRKRILIAIALIKEGSKSVASILCSLFFPVLPWIVEMILVGFFVAVAMYLASSGKNTAVVTEMDEDCDCPDIQVNSTCDLLSFNCTCAKCQFVKYRKDEKIFYFHLYNLFALFWGLCFMSAFEEIVLAGAFSSWYWTYDKSNFTDWALSHSTYRTFRYHLGTIAFGSLIIAIIRFIRAILEYIDQKVRKYDNKLARAILCCCKCCFWCLEKFLKFVNRNAYIICAMYGKNFCSSAKRAFELIMRNILRVVVLDKAVDFLLFLGKMVVVGGMCVASFFVFSKRLAEVDDVIPDTNYYLVPVITITLATYFVASIFFDVFGMAVDTLFICFLEDCERNDGSVDRPYYMSKELMKILGKKNKFKETTEDD